MPISGNYIFGTLSDAVDVLESKIPYESQESGYFVQMFFIYEY